MIEKIAQEWELRGYTCGVWEDSPGSCWEDFIHDTDELFMLLKGKVELQIAGKKLHPKKDEVIHIPAKTIHSVRNIGKTKACYLYGYKMESANERDMAAFNS